MSQELLSHCWSFNTTTFKSNNSKTNNQSILKSLLLLIFSINISFTNQAHLKKFGRILEFTLEGKFTKKEFPKPPADPKTPIVNIYLDMIKEAAGVDKLVGHVIQFNCPYLRTYSN